MSLWRLDESKIWWEASSLKNQVRVDVPVWFQIRLQAEFPHALEKVKWKIPWGSSQSKDWTRVSCIAGRFFTVWATRKAFALERSAFILLSPSTDWMRAYPDAEAPILWPPDAKNWLIGKDPDARNDWRQEKGTTEDEWYHQRDGHEFEQAPGVGDGQGTLACCSPWGHKEPDTTEWLNWLTGP